MAGTRRIGWAMAAACLLAPAAAHAGSYDAVACSAPAAAHPGSYDVVR